MSWRVTIYKRRYAVMTEDRNTKDEAEDLAVSLMEKYKNMKNIDVSIQEI